MKESLVGWLEHPVTKRYLELLREHREAHINRMLNMGTLDAEKLPELAQLKGQVNTLDLMLDTDQLENFFAGELE